MSSWKCFQSHFIIVVLNISCLVHLVRLLWVRWEIIVYYLKWMCWWLNSDILLWYLRLDSHSDTSMMSWKIQSWSTKSLTSKITWRFTHLHLNISIITRIIQSRKFNTQCKVVPPILGLHPLTKISLLLMHSLTIYYSFKPRKLFLSITLLF